MYWMNKQKLNIYARSVVSKNSANDWLGGTNSEKYRSALFKYAAQ